MVTLPPQPSCPDWIDILNRRVLAQHRTRLVGGFDEPFYRARCDDGWAEIRFTRDYERSALHELAHWCVAGPERRRLDDFGYWYAPDGRSNEQQQLFFRVEVRPQAIEKLFCAALDIGFEVSVDNLGNRALDGVGGFCAAVEHECARLQQAGLPRRIADIEDCLCRWRAGTG